MNWPFMVHFDACVFPFASSCNCSFFPSLIFSVTISVSGTVSSCPVHCFLFFPRCPSFLVCLSLSLPPPRTSPCSWQSGCCWGGGAGRVHFLRPSHPGKECISLRIPVALWNSCTEALHHGEQGCFAESWPALPICPSFCSCLSQLYREMGSPQLELQLG